MTSIEKCHPRQRIFTQVECRCVLALVHVLGEFRDVMIAESEVREPLHVLAQRLVLHSELLCFAVGQHICPQRRIGAI